MIPLWKIERDAILQALHVTDGNVPEAAKRLEIGQATIYRKLKKYGLTLKGVVGTGEKIVSSDTNATDMGDEKITDHAYVDPGHNIWMSGDERLCARFVETGSGRPAACAQPASRHGLPGGDTVSQFNVGGAGTNLNPNPPYMGNTDPNDDGGNLPSSRYDLTQEGDRRTIGVGGADWNALQEEIRNAPVPLAKAAEIAEAAGVAAEHQAWLTEMAVKGLELLIKGAKKAIG